ncbi:hypothetical protein MC885_020245 [Smutsia gigantea]|nr:hypothetical protein MC885_020245 [Smutsia gigantea]
MASPSRQAPLGGSGLLQGSRARSYGSLVQSACSPVRERRLEHQLAPGDTLAGLALKYGVTKTLYIPILTEPRDLFNGLDSEEEKDGGEEIQPSKDEVWPPSAERKKQRTRSGHGSGAVLPAPSQGPPAPIHDLSASDFLKKLDSQISLSKKAAAQKLKKEESRVPGEDSGLHPISPRMRQQALLGPVQLTRTSRTQTLRDQEDEIFKL